MTQKSRYLLLLLGFVVFAILAPLTVLYVRGISFNFKTGKFLPTGMLAIRSDPGTVDVFLNGKLIRKKAGDFPFLTPGDYHIELKKEGYSSWSKHLGVLPGQVSWA